MSNPKDIKLTESQQSVLDKIKTFIDSKDRVFILKGYAGTGKTTLMRFLIEYLKSQKKSYKLLTPTGRAAKILANYTGSTANTIHSLIYRYQSFNRDVENIDDLFKKETEVKQLTLNFAPLTRQDVERREAIKKGKNNDIKEIIYIIDEASMVSDFASKKVVQAQFGSGRLLLETFYYDELPESKFIFVGDPCQLPPIMAYFSPALDSDYIQKEFNYTSQETQLTQIMRQKDDNTIIQAATTIRKLWEKAPIDKLDYGRNRVWGFLPIKKYKDIKLMPNLESMEDKYLRDVKQYGYNHSIFICRSNKDCSLISQKIRQQLGFKKAIEVGDILMIVQNQYTTGLMNGDMVEVIGVENNKISTPYNKYQTHLSFRRVTVRELFTQKESTTLLIEETLTSPTNNLDTDQQTSLFVDFITRMKKLGITEKKQSEAFRESLYNDPYLNALRCSYGYAVTCHKAQGGEWNNVYIHFGARNLTLNPTKTIYQWVYTALTRAKENVFLVDDFYIN